MAEAFTSTEASGLPVVPNQDLKPEKSLSIELGWNEIIDPSLMLDISFFLNNYWDLIEGGFHEGDGNTVFIRFDNVTKARITGFETNLNWWAVKNKLRFNIGYTYVDPQNLTINDYLNYRPRHLLYTEAEWKYGIFRLGLDYRYISRYDRIDEQFDIYINDADERVAAQIVDIHLAAGFDVNKIPLQISLQLNNLFQYNYIDFVGSIAPIRNFILSVDADF